MNPARLAELQHQRALIREHLAWLEQEIAKESPTSPPAVISVAVQGAVPREVPAVFTPSPALAALVDSEAYAPDPISTAAQTRRGCLTAVVILLVLLAAALTAIYFWRYSDRPIIFTSGPPAADSSSVK